MIATQVLTSENCNEQYHTLVFLITTELNKRQNGRKMDRHGEKCINKC